MLTSLLLHKKVYLAWFWEGIYTDIPPVSTPLDSCNFIARMFFREAYWRSCLFTYVLLFYFKLHTVFCVMSYLYVSQNAVCHWFIKLLSDLIWSDRHVPKHDRSTRASHRKQDWWGFWATRGSVADWASSVTAIVQRLVSIPRRPIVFFVELELTVCSHPSH